MARDRNRPVKLFQPNRLLDGVLSFILFIECVGIVYILKDDRSRLYEFLGLCLASSIAIQSIKYISTRFGTFISNNLLHNPPFNNPLSKERNLRKFEDQMWQLVVHTFFSFLEYHALNAIDFQWLWKPHLCFENLSNQVIPREIEILYFAQLAVWFFTAFSHCFLEKSIDRRSDYFVMYGHHVTTIALVIASYKNNFFRMGLLVLFVHDVSDIVVDLLKVFNYLSLEDAKGLFLTEICFITNFATWGYFRLYLLPVYLVYYGTFTANMPNWKTIDGTVTYIDVVKSEFGEDSQALFMTKYVVGPLCNVLLATLVVMHIYWFFLFIRLLQKLVTSGSAHNAASKEYEGNSESDGEIKNK